ncbi:MAG TPA: glycosyltransferase family 4 protein [Capsulimonadaceae bacterium]
MNQVLLIGRPATGGLRAHIAELVRRLDRTNYAPWVCGPTAFIDDLPADLPTFVKAACPIAAKLGPGDFAAANRLRRIVSQARTSGPVLVHAHGIRAAWIAAIAHVARPFPFVVTLHNIPPAGPLGAIALRFLTARADQVVCVSQAIADRVQPEAMVIPNGVEVSRYASLDRVAARKEIGIDAEAFVVGCIARLSPEKGVDVLIEAAAALPNTLVLIAGDGPERDVLSANLPPNVRLLGQVASVLPVLAASDVIAVPSRSEGQGIVALEALAAGRAVVASNVGGLPEMIEQNVTGLLVDVGDPTKLADAIRQLVTNDELRRRLGDAGQRYAQGTGDIEARTRQLETVYAAVLG